MKYIFMYNIIEYTLKHMDISVAPGRRSSRPRAGVGADAQLWPLRNKSAMGKWDIWIDGWWMHNSNISVFGWMIYINISDSDGSIFWIDGWWMYNTHMDTGWYRPPWPAAKWVWVHRVIPAPPDWGGVGDHLWAIYTYIYKSRVECI
jgi:hypothetical protein